MILNHAIFEGDRARKYDSFVENWIPLYGQMIQMLPALLQDAPKRRALVVGCGTGNEMLSLLQDNPRWHLSGIDPSPEMIRKAQQKLSAYPQAEFFEGYLSDFDHQELYGAASLSLVLHFIKYPADKRALLRNIYQRLAPGAPLVIYGIFGTNREIKENLKGLVRLLPKDTDRTEIEQRKHRIMNELHRDTDKQLIRLLDSAGFEEPVRFFQCSIYSGWITYKSERTIYQKD